MTVKKQMTLEEWKAGVEQSSHVQKGEEVIFTEPNQWGFISALVRINVDRSVFLGTYFTKDNGMAKAGTGWYHE